MQKIAERQRPDRTWRETNAEEIRVFIGLCTFMSIVSLPSLKMHWSKDFAFSNFFPAKVMAGNRFDKRAQYFHANNKEAMELDANGRPKDKLVI